MRDRKQIEQAFRAWLKDYQAGNHASDSDEATARAVARRRSPYSRMAEDSMTSAAAPAIQVSPERRTVVDRAREAWTKKLIDLSRRNNLLYFRPLKRGTLDFSSAPTDRLESLLSGDAVSLARLLPDLDSVKTAAQVVEIHRRALANREERNLETLFIAFGLATWTVDDGGRPPEAPVLLIPVQVETRKRDEVGVALRRAGEPQMNPVLLHVLENVHGCRVAVGALLNGADNEAETAIEPAAVYARLEKAVRGLSGFNIRPAVVLGNFAFHKMAMVRDLKECGDLLAGYDLVAALAGDLAARSQLAATRSETDPRDLDRTPPQREFLILDADSSQQCVIAGALTGQDGVIQGPPGTGKSQTIANLVAELAAAGKRTLFVAQKRAALEVVIERLERAGLGHLALDLHGAELSRRAVMERFAESLALLREIPPVDSDELHGRLAACRARLNEHVARLHQPRSPSDLSVFDLQARLLSLADVTSRVRWRGTALAGLDAKTASAARDLLTEAGGFANLFLGRSASPWNNAALSDGATVVAALDVATSLAHDHLPEFEQRLAAMNAATGVPVPRTLDATAAFLTLAEGVNSTLARYKEELFNADLDALAAGLSRASGRVSAAWARCTSARFRAARRAAVSLRGGIPVPSSTLRAEICEAAAQKRCWNELVLGSRPTATSQVGALRTAHDDVVKDVAALAALIGRTDLSTLGLDTLRHLVETLARDTTTAAQVPRVREVQREIEKLGIGLLTQGFRETGCPAEAWVRVFDHAWLTSCLDAARAEDPALAAFSGRTHGAVVEEFRRLDRERVIIAAARVRRAHAEHAVRVMNEHRDQAQAVRHEAGKRAKHRPLRNLFIQAAEVMTALRPCWMVSPLSVAELLPALPHFDIVLFDEASQVLPEDAVSALLRGKRAIVAGDQHQLPPTAFFAAGGDDDQEDEDSPSAVAGFESVLDLMSAFLEPWRLQWHYRSRDESLIAFSNRHIYGDRLITFPGPGGPPCVTHLLVAQAPGKDGEEESAAEEVRRVVDLVLEHARARPDETLGVITMGIRHKDRVQAALDAELRDLPELASYFDETRVERFFVKNLERVQGDERDAIILSIGYGKDRGGKLPYRFGPLLSEGGERRLNVAITRARRRLTVVSSFSHQDMDPARSSARGVELLRLYLQYAASGERLLGDSGASGVPLNPFEADVSDALTARGIPILPQWGASCYRIDLVAQHPRERGRSVLAIECDGATYHSAPTARDRDRLRQQQLEALGWKFHRIWSTDWFLRREEEIERAAKAWKKAVREMDEAPRVVGGIRDGRATGRGHLLLGERAFEKGRGEATGKALKIGAGRADTSPSQTRQRSKRPSVPSGMLIHEYRPTELSEMVRWIESDGRLRTDDQIIDEMMQELGFSRRGSRIDAAMRSAVEQARRGATMSLSRRVILASP